MPEWWSYRLSDLLLFSPRTYYRMFELYHHDIWPVHLLVFALTAAAVILIRTESPWRNQAIAAMVAASWLWVAIAFHLQRYATINWAARYFSILFGVQVLLLVWYGVVRGRVRLGSARGGRTRVGIGLLVVACGVQPIAGVLAGRTWRQVELIGITPDATAIATIALLALSAAGLPRALLVIPVAWCAIGGATLWALGSGEAWLVLLSGLCGVGLAAGYPGALQSVLVEHEERSANQ
jgi:hypothetical protein